MLKRRIIPIQLLLNGRLVKSTRFDSFRDVGDPLKSSQVYADQDADELLLLNVARERRDVTATAGYLRQIAEACFMPIAAGGGITSIDDASTLFAAGADKVVINSAAYDRPDLLQEIARRYGSQALTISIDVLRDRSGTYRPHLDCGRRPAAVTLDNHVARMSELGAGEIMINSVDNDGVMRGYDLELLARVRQNCTLPLIICGGAGDSTHLLDAFHGGADAVACGSLFNFGDNNPLRVKAFLKNRDVPLKRI
jgi:cyclase